MNLTPLNMPQAEKNNDASASAFGWNFQVNAGIFLFLDIIVQAESMKMESKLEDIEIRLSDGTLALAQAKSARDPSTAKNKKEKFKDALVSLSKIKDKNFHFIYISNISDTFQSTKDGFDNNVVSYLECMQSIKDEIDKTKDTVVESLRKSNKQIQAQRLQDFNMDNFHISTITGYWGTDNRRYIQIEKKITQFLGDTLGLNLREVNFIQSRLQTHWQSFLAHNATIKDDNVLKEITKKDFVWPIVVILSEIDIERLNDCMTFSVDRSFLKEVEFYLESIDNIAFEKFRIVNSILIKYKNFKNTTKGDELEFIKSHYQEFIDNFGELHKDEDIVEYLTKAFMLKIITNHRNINKITKGAGINNDYS